MKPDVLPQRHGDAVAEPLVGELVHQHVLEDRRLDELPAEDRQGLVLQRPGEPTHDGDSVLIEGVGAEPLLEDGDHLPGAKQRRRGVGVLQVGRENVAYGDLLGRCRLVLDDLPAFSDDDGRQVGGHRVAHRECPRHGADVIDLFDERSVGGAASMPGAR